MTDLLDTAFLSEGYTAVMVGRCIAALDSLTKSVVPVDATPGLEFFVIVIASQVKASWRLVASLGAGGDHILITWKYNLK